MEPTWKDLTVSKPFADEFRPAGDPRMRISHADAMHAFLEDVKLDGNIRLSASGEVRDRVLRRDGGVLGSMEEKGRRGIGCDLQFVGEKIDQLGIGVVAEQVLLRAGVRE